VTADGLPGVTRSFDSFAAAAAEAGRSRVYGGIHYQFDNANGLALGGEVAGFVVGGFLNPRNDDDGGDFRAVTAKPAPMNASLRAGQAQPVQAEALAYWQTAGRCTTPGNPGEQGRMDLLTVPEHEIGHLLGRGHEASGGMQDTVVVGNRRTVRPALAPNADWFDAGLTGLKLDETAPWVGDHRTK
jgi:hypothetical protein